MTSVRLYVQQLINHAIVSELQFPTSWKVFDLQFPILQEQYLSNVELLNDKLKNFEADGSRIMWLLDRRDTTILVNAISRINIYFRAILRGDTVTMQQLGEDKDLLRAGIALEKSYGKSAGTGDNTIGKWTPVVYGQKLDWTIGTYQGVQLPTNWGSRIWIQVLSDPGNLIKFGGNVMVLTEDGAFKADKPYFEYKDEEYILLEPGTDYQVGDIVADFGFPIYEESVLKGDLIATYVDLWTQAFKTPAQANQIQENAKTELLNGILKAKYGDNANYNYWYNQEPVIYNFTYDSVERISSTVRNPYSGLSVEYPDAKFTFRGAHITNIADLNNQGIALFTYDANYDWEKDVSLNKSITSNLHIRKLTKGWFGSGKSGWSRDINSLPYIQTLDEHDWAKTYPKYVKTYESLVKDIDVHELLALVNGDSSKFYLLFTIANLYAIRHELLSIFFRALNEIRKKGMYRV